MAPTVIKHFIVTIPAGTAIAAPLVTLTQFEPNVVHRIEWTFPSGCNGQVGIQVGTRDVPVLPGDRTAFFTTSGDSHGVDLEEMHMTGDWSVIGYNTGKFSHSIRVAFMVSRIPPEPRREHYWADVDLSDYAPIPVGG